jgi:DNA-binding transcriptional ArsR family regulator
MVRNKKWKMSPDALQHVAARFRVLAEPMRLQILQVLEPGELSVGELANAVGSTQPNVSKHLKILQDEGLISRRKEGNAVYYSIADPSVFELCDVVCGSLKAEFAGRSAIFK